MADLQSLTRDELKQKMDRDDDFILIDVLGERSYDRAHLPDAIMIDAHDDDFVKNVEAMVPEKDQEIVVYCASFECQLSPKAADKLREAGYTSVYDFEGGLKDWAEGGYDFEGEEAEEVKTSLRE